MNGQFLPESHLSGSLFASVLAFSAMRSKGVGPKCEDLAFNFACMPRYFTSTVSGEAQLGVRPG